MMCACMYGLYSLVVYFNVKTYDLHKHYSADELCLVALISNFVWKSSIWRLYS